MPPSRDVRLAINPLAVRDRNLNDLQAHPCRTEDQIEITEGVKISEIGPIASQLLIVTAGQNLGSAKRIFKPLAQHERECHREELVTQQVHESHGPRLHWIDQSAPIDELTL